MRRHVRRALLLAVCGLIACVPESTPKLGTEKYAATPALAIEFNGCEQLYRDRHCVLARGQALTLWIGGDDPQNVDLRLGTRRIDVAAIARATANGWTLRLDPSALPTTLRVRQTGQSSEFALAIDRLPHDTLDDEMQALLVQGNTAAVIARLRAALSERPAQAQGPILSRLARAQTRISDWASAESNFVAAIAAHAAAGRVSALISDRTTLAFHLLSRNGDLTRAAALLDFSDVAIAGDARGRMQIESSLGHLARLSGDLTAAERFYREAMQRAERVADNSREAVARTGLAQTWAEMGDFARASQTLTAITDAAVAELAVCDRARLRNSRAWIQLLAREAGVTLGDPLPDLDAASAQLESDCAFLGSERSNVAVNRALAYVQRGDTAAARSALADAQALNMALPAEQRAWMLEIEARIALVEGDAETALSRYRTLEQRADALLLIDAQWRAALGAAEAGLALGRVDAAIADLERADRLLNDYVQALPALESRALFLARFESLPKRWIEALLDRGRDEEAWQVARRYRNEPLRQVQRLARIGALDGEAQAAWRALMSRYRNLRIRLDAAASEDWQLSAEQLAASHAERALSRQQLRALVEQAAALGAESEAAPASITMEENELSLLYFPMTEGWSAFAFDQQGLRATRLAALALDAEPVRLTEQLLEPFRDQLDRAKKLRLMTYGPLQDLDFHRLAWNGAPLGSTHNVVYAADLASAPADARAERVLLVADPVGDLPAARAEVSGIEHTLRTRRPAITLEKLQGEAATANAIHSALAHATLFHYAGHTAQAQGVDAHIGFALSEGQRLELGDILMLERAPRLAVLAACDSADAITRTPAQALSLAHAFLARGSEDVVATTRPVDDAESAELTVALHTLHADGLPIDQALGEAQRQLLRSRPEGDWSAFRLYTR